MSEKKITISLTDILGGVQEAAKSDKEEFLSNIRKKGDKKDDESEDKAKSKKPSKDDVKEGEMEESIDAILGEEFVEFYESEEFNEIMESLPANMNFIRDFDRKIIKGIMTSGGQSGALGKFGSLIGTGSEIKLWRKVDVDASGGWNRYQENNKVALELRKAQALRGDNKDDDLAWFLVRTASGNVLGMVAPYQKDRYLFIDRNDKFAELDAKINRYYGGSRDSGESVASKIIDAAVASEGNVKFTIEILRIFNDRSRAELRRNRNDASREISTLGGQPVGYGDRNPQITAKYVKKLYDNVIKNREKEIRALIDANKNIFEDWFKSNVEGVVDSYISTYNLFAKIESFKADIGKIERKYGEVKHIGSYNFDMDDGQNKDGKLAAWLEKNKSAIAKAKALAA